MLKRLLILTTLLGMFCLLSACAVAGQAYINFPAAAPPLQSTRTPTVTAASGTFREYALPRAHSGLMRPTVDHEGRIWFGEMGQNALTVFDPHTHKFHEMTPPGGESGIMGVAVASDDSIWFAEQYANYIGHYDPATQQYQTYALPTLTTPDPTDKNKTLPLTSAPNDLAFDSHGNVWFTEMNADSIGMLDIQTHTFKHYQISAQKSVQKINPYGITIDTHDTIWFSEASTNNLGHLDPVSGKIRLFPFHDTNSTLMELVSDSQGTIWATTFNNSALLKFDPTKETFSSYLAPDIGTAASGLYGLSIGTSGEIWLTFTAANQIARFDISQSHFTFYQVPTPASMPLGLAISSDQTIWFTESANNSIGMLKP